MSTDKPFDPWALSSGLPLDGADVTIVEFAFGANQRIPGSENKTYANIKFLLDESGDEQEQSFSCGDAWVVTPGGESISGTDGKHRAVNDGTNWGIFITAAVNVVAEQTGDHISATLPGANPNEAAGWIGTRWTLGTKPMPSFKGRDGNMVENRKAIVPTAFLGTEAVKGATSSAAAAPKATVSAKAGKPTLKDQDPELYAQLLTLAAQFDDNDEFMAAALELDAVDASPLAVNAVMDQKATSLFAIAQANK